MRNFIERLLSAIYFFFSAIFNIHLKLKFVLPFCIVLGVGMYFYATNSVIKDVGGKEDYAEAKRYIEIKDIVSERFIQDADRKAMGESAAAAMISGLGDGWSYYMTDNEYKTYQLYSSNEFSDIGITMVKDEVSGGFQVLSVNVDSPASWAGLAAGMLITAVDGERLDAYTVDQARTLIRSKFNSVFVLEIGNDYSIVVDCTGTGGNSVNSRLEKTGAAYVQIKDFEAGSGTNAVNAVEDLLKQGAVSLVIDLRNNPGGLVSELNTLLDYLLPSGVLFSEKFKNGEQNVYESDGMCIQLPMCVLINSQTFREAEVCAAALKEKNWAFMMGEPTTGNTRTQETIALSDGSALRLSTGSYLTANGVDIAQNGGVIPDAIVYNSDASATGTTQGTTGGQAGTASTSNDEQLMAALRYLSQN